MCVANSARSQMAEGLARKILGEKAEIHSAGSEPKKVNPHAVQALREVGIDISTHYSKGMDDLDPRFVVGLDYIVTLCAEEVCPVVVSRAAEKLHWPFPDPAGPGWETMSREEVNAKFRTVRDQIEARINLFAKEKSL